MQNSKIIRIGQGVFFAGAMASVALWACSPKRSEPHTPPGLMIATGTPVVLPNSTATIPPTATPTHSVMGIVDSTMTARPPSIPARSCAPVGVAPGDRASMKGRFLVGNEGGVIGLLDAATGNLQTVADGIDNVVGFSQDGQWLAYSVISAESTTGDALTLKSADGDTLTIMPDQSEIANVNQESNQRGWGSAAWIGSDYLLVTLAHPTQSLEYTSVIFDPFGKQWRNDLLSVSPRIADSGAVSVAPDTGLVFYSAGFDDASGMTRYVLWNVAAREVAWSDSFFSRLRGGMEGYTAWNPVDSTLALVANSREVAEANRDEVYLVDMTSSGLTPITDLASGFGHVWIDGLAWSPNGRYLGFLVTTDGEDLNGPTGHDVYIYDGEARAVIKYCPLHGDKLLATHQSFTWSPDSRYLAYIGGFDLDGVNGEPALVVMDIQTDRQMIIIQPTHWSLAGWSYEYGP